MLGRIRTMNSRKIGLDYVRAAAILFVVICHYSVIFGVPHRTAYPLGVLGVELFFVLSGYLIGGIFVRDLWRAENKITFQFIRTFWIRRWLRTVPNYLLFLCVAASTKPTSVVWHSLPSYLTFTQNLCWSISPFYSISWSLCIEEWFYLLFPLIAFMGFRITGRSKWAVIMAASLLFLIPLMLRLTIGVGVTWDQGVRKVVMFRLDAIMCGVGLAACERYKPHWFNAVPRTGAAVVGCIGCFAACLWVGSRYTLGGDEFIGSVADALIFNAFDLSAILVVLAASSSKGLGRLPDRFAYLTSLWSYSMYLAHLPVIISVIRLADSVGLAWVGPKLMIPLAVVANFGASAGVYYLFEAPILRLRDKWTSHAVDRPVQRAEVFDAEPSSELPSH